MFKNPALTAPMKQTSDLFYICKPPLQSTIWYCNRSILLASPSWDQNYMATGKLLPCVWKYNLQIKKTEKQVFKNVFRTTRVLGQQLCH